VTTVQIQGEIFVLRWDREDCHGDRCPNGVTYTWKSVVDPDQDVYLNHSSTPNYTNITFDILKVTPINPISFDVSVDTLSSLDFTFVFRDDSRCDGDEAVTVKVDGTTIVNDREFGSFTFSKNGYTGGGVAGFQSDGLLIAKIKATDGDFYFVSASVNATGCDNSTQVPEPTTIFMLGLGLDGLAGIRRKM
jgi:hypothetical protein